MTTPTIITAPRLELPEQVQALVDRATAVDGYSPVNELGARAITAGRPGSHWLAQVDDDLVGWAWLDPADGSVQLVVDPEHRRQGVGTALATAVRDQGQPQHWWAFGTLPGALALAARLGLALSRQLLIMVRDLDAHPADPVQLPEGVKLTGFTQADTDDLVRVNAQAFAHHPEQGAMSAEDVRAKAAEPWFSAQGLLLAKQAGTGELMGFHWTKLEQLPGSRPEGEVYVIGVAPAFEHQGLGRFLLNAGLAHLADQGVQLVKLYVEASLPRVVQLYSSANFDVHTRDSSFAPVVQDTGA